MSTHVGITSISPRSNCVLSHVGRSVRRSQRALAILASERQSLKLAPQRVGGEVRGFVFLSARQNSRRRRLRSGLWLVGRGPASATGSLGTARPGRARASPQATGRELWGSDASLVPNVHVLDAPMSLYLSETCPRRSPRFTNRDGPLSAGTCRHRHRHRVLRRRVRQPHPGAVRAGARHPGVGGVLRLPSGRLPRHDHHARAPRRRR